MAQSDMIKVLTKMWTEGDGCEKRHRLMTEIFPAFNVYLISTFFHIVVTVHLDICLQQRRALLYVLGSINQLAWLHVQTQLRYINPCF